MFRLEFDGLVRELEDRPSAGIMCYGWRILQKRKIVAHGHGTFASGLWANANAAEYLALIEGLEALVDMRLEHERILVCGDSKSVIRQMQGTAGVSSASVKPLYRKARSLADEFEHLRWNWLPRAQNRAADALSRVALRLLHVDVQGYEALLERLRTSKAPTTAMLDVGGLCVYMPARM